MAWFQHLFRRILIRAGSIFSSICLKAVLVHCFTSLEICEEPFWEAKKDFLMTKFRNFLGSCLYI